jgi:hypothetical protein
MTRTFAQPLPTARNHVHWNQKTGNVESPEAEWDRMVAMVKTEIGNGEKLHEVTKERDALKLELAKVKEERDALASDLWCAEDQWGTDYLWKKWKLSRLLTDELKQRLLEKCAERESRNGHPQEETGEKSCEIKENSGIPE